MWLSVLCAGIELPAYFEVKTSILPASPRQPSIGISHVFKFAQQ